MTELEFGARLKQLRQNKHMTQQELADQLGVSNKSVSRRESGGYPDVTILAPLAKALGVSTDELLGCQPPLRSFGRSDWQNLMSYAFALGGGVVFYLFDLFMPVVICYLLYLAMMAYGIYLQRHYTYHSHWFYGANALMDFFVNLQLTAFTAGGSMLFSGIQSFALMMTSMGQGERMSYFYKYTLNLLQHVLPWFFITLVLTGITQMVIYRTANGSVQLPKLALHRTRPELIALPPILSPVLLAIFWQLYTTEDPGQLWVYQYQLFFVFRTVAAADGADCTVSIRIAPPGNAAPRLLDAVELSTLPDACRRHPGILHRLRTIYRVQPSSARRQIFRLRSGQRPHLGHSCCSAHFLPALLHGAY